MNDPKWRQVYMQTHSNSNYRHKKVQAFHILLCSIHICSVLSRYVLCRVTASLLHVLLLNAALRLHRLIQMFLGLLQKSLEYKHPYCEH
jgi:hypothetical protein